jgi:GNAT superfamily N-acetyltransferase
LAFNLGQYSLVKLQSGYTIKNFDCTDADLNAFFSQEALPYYDQLLTVTYVLETPDKTAGFFSLSNDKIQRAENKPIWNRLNRHIKFEKRRSSYPAVKLGRLGIDRDFQSTGVGTLLLKFIKNFVMADTKTGCRFITVDAYNNEKTLRFYRKHDFEFFLENDTHEKTRLMFFDLLPLKDTAI